MNNTEKFLIDDITWNDLDLEVIYERMNTCRSQIGREYLKRELKTLLFDQNELKSRNEKIKFFDQNEKNKKQIQKHFSKLGIIKKYLFTDYIYKLKEVPEMSNAPHIILGILLLLAIVLIFFQPVFGIIAIVIMIAVNILTYFKGKAKIEAYFLCLKYLVSMDITAKKILSDNLLDGKVFAGEIEDLKRSVKIFAPLKNGSWLITNSVSGSFSDVIMDYIRMFFHVDLIKFNSMRRIAMENEEQIQILYDSLGEIETAACISDYRNDITWSEPVFYSSESDTELKPGSHALIAENIYHPLTENAVANSISTEKSILLTGANASGKSTFLKALALNQIFAQTLYMTFSEKFITTFYKVMTSMALKDNILGKESYFVVEIKSLKRIFDELGDIPVMCFVDEVLRGTNTIERISASSRILEDISKDNALVFAATHDIELTELLKDSMINYHFSETVSDEKVIFDYKLKEGPSNSSNAILLLKSYGFNEEIIKGAVERMNTFKSSGTWE